MNYDNIIANFGSTGLGAVYTFWVSNDGDNRPHWVIQNQLQAVLMNTTRLGIPVTIVQETLHGGLANGTVFPMPCGMGGTWDPALIGQVGSVIGLEARIGGVDRGFSPELNIATDPRFGRTEENFSEV
jgi:beta-glucosidase